LFIGFPVGLELGLYFFIILTVKHLNIVNILNLDLRGIRE